MKLTGNTLESLRKFLSSCLRQEEGGESAKERAEAEDEEGEDWGELGKVDDHGGEEDCDATDNFTERHPLSTDDCGEDLAAVLEADEESTVGSHPSNEGDSQAN